MADTEPAPERDHDDAAGLDGRGSANIFDVEDAFEPTEAEELGEATDPADDDGYEPDDALGAGDPDGPLLRYDGGEYIEGVPTRGDIVAEQDSGGTAAAVRKHLDARRTAFFMPTDVEETNEYNGGYPVYVLRLFGTMMDGSKADVTVTGVDVFFDVRVPERPPTAAMLSKAGQDKLAGLEPGRVAVFDAHLRQPSPTRASRAPASRR